MFDAEGLIILEDFFKDKFNYNYRTYEDLLKQDFIRFESNGATAKFWIKYEGEEYLYKEDDLNHVLGELLGQKIAEALGIPCAQYRACTFSKDKAQNSLGGGVLTKKVYYGNETLVLGAQIIQEAFNNYYNGKKIKELLQDPDFRLLYSIPDNLLKLREDILLKNVYNYFNNLEQLWGFFEMHFEDSQTSYLMINYLIEVFLYDIFTMSADRHLENWGAIKSYPSGLYRPCPLFDNSDIFGIYDDTSDRIARVNRNMPLLNNANSISQFNNLFYERKMLLCSTESDVTNVKAKKRKTSIEMLYNFLKVVSLCNFA